MQYEVLCSFSGQVRFQAEASSLEEAKEIITKKINRMSYEHLGKRTNWEVVYIEPEDISAGCED